jgi:hypothetical protein
VDAMESGNFKYTKAFFVEMKEIGSVENRMAIEYGTKVLLFRNPKSDFNGFRKSQISSYTK